MDPFPHKWSGKESFFSSPCGVGGEKNAWEGMGEITPWGEAQWLPSFHKSLTATPSMQGESESPSADLKPGFSSWSLLESANMSTKMHKNITTERCVEPWQWLGWLGWLSLWKRSEDITKMKYRQVRDGKWGPRPGGQSAVLFPRLCLDH